MYMYSLVFACRHATYSTYLFSKEAKIPWDHPVPCIQLDDGQQSHKGPDIVCNLGWGVRRFFFLGVYAMMFAVRVTGQVYSDFSLWDSVTVISVGAARVSADFSPGIPSGPPA